MADPPPLLVGIEGGGTTFVAGLATVADPLTLIARTSVDTTDDPNDTLAAVTKWTMDTAAGRPLAAVGLAMFGPLDLAAATVTSTPKPGWRDAPVGSLVRGVLGPLLPLRIDTDVNAAAVGQHRALCRRGELQAADSLVYVTVGTGVGVGLVSGGRPVHGLLHPELGHMRPPRHGDDVASGFGGTCPYHGDCIEGLVASGALAERRGVARAELAGLGDDDALWDVVAFYLAQLVATCVLAVSPHRIVLGGGIMQRSGLLEKVRQAVRASLNGYVQHPSVLTDEGLARFVTAPEYGQNAGLMGALELAHEEAEAAAQ